MSIDFSELVNPSILHIELSIILITFIGLFAFIGVKMRSGLIFTFWVFMIIILVFSFVTPLDFIWYWIIVILNIFVIVFVGIWSYLI